MHEQLKDDINFEQDWQCTYNVTLRRVRATIVAVEKQLVSLNSWVCVCSPRYPAHNAHAPYCQMRSVRLYSIFQHYLISGTIFFFLKLLNKKVCSYFPYNFAWNISHSKKTWARYDQKCILVFMWSVHYFCRILVKLAFSRNTRIFEKFSNINFMKIRPVGAELLHRTKRRTDMTKANSRFSQFCEKRLKTRSPIELPHISSENPLK